MTKWTHKDVLGLITLLFMLLALAFVCHGLYSAMRFNEKCNDLGGTVVQGKCLAVKEIKID